MSRRRRIKRIRLMAWLAKNHLPVKAKQLVFMTILWGLAR